MKRKFTLGQQLTLVVGVFFAAMSFVAIVVYFQYFQRNINTMTFDTVRRGAEASAQLFASKWMYDVYTIKAMGGDPEGARDLERQFESEMKKNEAIVGITVLGVMEGADTKKLSFSSGLMELARKVSEDADRSTFLNGVSDFRKPFSALIGDHVFAGTPIIVEGHLEAYLVRVESVRKYNRFQFRFSMGIVSMLLTLVVLQMVVVSLIGRRVSLPLKKLADTAIQIASGDLTRSVVMDKGLVAETESLTTAVQNMSRALVEQVTLIKNLTQQVSDLSREASKAMSHLAGSATEQAAAVSETATTVEEMEKAGKNVTQAVKRIVEVADRSAAASSRGRESVDTATGIIVQIKEDSGNISRHSRTLLSNVEEIGNIINSVNAISEQSKILAVNASIEAAKAGEYGAGFAVVAQEVKNLAGQSREATEQITRTLVSIRQAIEGMVKMSSDGEERTVMGVSSIANTGAIVNDLSDAIQEASMVAAEIDSAVSQQTTGLTQIATAMEEINSAAIENQSISLQMADSTNRITTSLDELAALVDVWNTSNSTS